MLGSRFIVEAFSDMGSEEEDVEPLTLKTKRILVESQTK